MVPFGYAQIGGPSDLGESIAFFVIFIKKILHPGGLETPLAIVWTAKTVYPELFGDINLETQVKGFYKQFFNLNLDKEMLDKILNGRGMRLENSP